MLRRRKSTRPGTIIVLTTLTLMIILAFIALAIDLGLLMLARNQSQVTADAAAMAGARTLTGDVSTNNNYDKVTPNAQAAAAANSILGQAVDPAAQLGVTIGDYYYDSGSSSFKINPNGKQPGNNWTLVQATIQSQRQSYFSKLLGTSSLNTGALATAVHRPRDTAIVVDFSGSMRFESMLGGPHYGSRTPMNPDSVYPTFGHYAGNSSKLIYAGDMTVSSGEQIGKANVAVATAAAPGTVIEGFYADTAPFGTSTPAFSLASSTYASTPGGDVPLKVSQGSGSSYAKHVSEHLANNSTTTSRDMLWELDGYSAYSAGVANTTTGAASDYASVPFNAYTQGPNYWGKSFFTWPPDPRVPLTTTYYPTSTYPNAIPNLVYQFLRDFRYTAMDFANTSQRTSLTAGINTTVTSISVSSSTAARFPSTTPFKIMVGTTTGSSPNITFSTASSIEVMNVTSVSGTTWTVQRAQDGTTAKSFTSGKAVGLLTAPGLYGLFTPANTPIATNVGKTPSTSNDWTSWPSASDLGTYITDNLFQPGTKSNPDRKNRLTTTDAEYLQTLRLFNRNGGPGMPKDGSGNAMPANWIPRFFKTTSGDPLMDPSKLFDTSGTLKVPRDGNSNNYRINYDAILDWIKNCGTNPFPNQLRAGGIVYYTSIPTTINVNTFPPPDPNQRLWKEYIDEVLGVQQTSGSGSTPVYDYVADLNGLGDDYSWGTASMASSLPSGWPARSPASFSATSPTSIRYTDTPKRPRLRTWFGPLSLVDFLGNYNAYNLDTGSSMRLWWPGTVKETPTYQTKLAIQAAVKDTIRNHPNDLVSLIFFSSPKSSANGSGYYNYTRAPMGRDQRAMINALWFSPKVNTTGNEISLYDSSGASTGDIYDVPRANGGTCYNMPLMLAYNQFSSNPTLVNYTANALPGTAGGLGRVGASKMLVFETDGMVNTGASAGLASSGNGTGYYRVRISDANNFGATGGEFPSSVSGVSFSTGATQSQAITQQICNDLTAGGFSTTRKPVLVHCIAFGSLFEPSNSSSSKTNALQNLATLEVIGKVQQSGATTLASSKIIVGDFNTRIANMQTALSNIMQDGVQVTLISSGTGKP